MELSTIFMRYSPEVKMFWRTGLKLFRGSFLRFMGGQKNKGQVINSEATPGLYTPHDSKVNFVVPDRRMLKEDSLIMTEKKPAILHNMIDVISKNDHQQYLTYKICVDGKRINPTSKGEVNMWGYEASPTYEQKAERLDHEIKYFSGSLEDMKKQIEYGHNDLKSVNTDTKKTGC